MYDLYHAIHKDSASMYAQTYISCQQSSVAYMVEYAIIWAINLGGSLIFGNEQFGYDRTIVMHYFRLGGNLASAVGSPWIP